MSIITPIHSSSIPSIHPFLPTIPVQLHNCIFFLYIFFMNSTELELVVTLVDSTFCTSIYIHTRRGRDRITTVGNSGWIPG